MATKKRAKDKPKKDSDSESSDSEHELSYYINDRIKLMQQVLSLIKPKKIISMAPDSMKDMQPSAMKSLLLEELLGISNKRLRSILAGENCDDDTSSDSQIDKEENAEVISLDDITDGSEIYISDDNDNNCMEIQLSERERLELELEKENPKTKDKTKKGKDIVIKKETDNKKRKKHRKKTIKEENNDEPVVNVLNLLELQARARAIRSQLASEILSKEPVNTDVLTKDLVDIEIKKSKSDDDCDSVICVSPQNPVVMIQSNSEEEDNNKIKTSPKEIVDKPNNEIVDKESPININSNDEDYNNDVLIVTEDDITLDKDSITPSINSTKVTKSNEDNIEDTDTWKSRWLESKKVQDVMKTTKLYNSLRQKRKQKRTDSEEHETDTPETNIIEDVLTSKEDIDIEETSKNPETTDENIETKENTENN